jgi:hypothetical protein
MKSFHFNLIAALLVLASGSIAPAHGQGSSKLPQAADTRRSGVHDFDFQAGDWRVHHRVKRPADSQWEEFDGTSSNRSLMDGAANVEDNTFYRPSGVTRGVALRAYDPKTGEWAIWWIDGRNPLGALDPPVKGRFIDGVGTFYSDGILNGKPTRTRFIWSHITATSARWEQAYSSDSGKTWETNWIMEFQRVR